LKISSVEYFSGFNYPAADKRYSIHGNSLHLKGSSDDGAEQDIINLPKGHFILSAYVRLVNPVPPNGDVYLSVHKGDEEIAGRWASSVTLIGDQKWRMVKVPFPNSFEGNYTIRVTKKGTGDAYIDNIGLMPVYSDNPFDITIDTSDIAFKIQDGNTQKGIPDCKITFNNQEYISDENGMLLLEDIIANQYSLIVEKEGYYEYSNDAFEIYSDSTITINLSPVGITGNIYIMDLSTGQPVYRALITFNDSKIALSSRDGSTAYESQPGEKVDYLIEHNDYFTEEGMYEIYNDSSLVIELTPVLATVIFSITGNGEIVSATVNFNGNDYETSAGIVSIYHPARQSYDYSILKDGYDEITGSVWLEKDTTITIDLAAISLISRMNEHKLNVYPNPASTRLYVKLWDNLINGEIKITNITGELIHVQKVNGIVSEVDISNLDEGAYFLRIVPNELNQNIMFIKP